VIPHPSPNANAKYIFEQGQGKIDSGSVIAATIVALRSRKNSKTTITASAAPSYNDSRAE
jgi:hypothetical protein